MSSLILASDLHIRDKPYKDDLEVSMNLLDDLLFLAKKHKSEAIVITGDMFHEKKPSYELSILLYEKLKEIQKEGIEFVWVRGNHDLSLKSNPHQGLMTMYDKVCKTVMKPYIIEEGIFFLAFVPWYEGKLYKRILQKVHTRALESKSRIKILFSHIGVKEGEVGENYRVNQEVGSKDFCEELYDFILLGDYHTHQQLTEKIWYLGACLPRDFGHTAAEYGPWLLNLAPSAKLSRLYLPRKYPDYKVYDLTKPRVIPGYDSINKNRIKCPVEIAPQVLTMYPDADIIYTGEESFEYTPDRLVGLKEGDWSAIWKEFSTMKGWEGDIVKTGRNYLYEASK